MCPQSAAYRQARHGESVAHFLCELAEEAMSIHRLKDARDLLGQALQEDPGCVRASIAKAKLEHGNGEFRQALKTLKGIEKQNPVYLQVALPLIRQCWDRQGTEREMLDYLEHIYRDFGVVAAVVDAAESIRNSRGSTAALEYLLPVLKENPEPLAVCRALEWLAEDRSAASEKVRLLSNMLNGFISDKSGFHCVECGFTSSELYCVAHPVNIGDPSSPQVLRRGVQCVYEWVTSQFDGSGLAPLPDPLNDEPGIFYFSLTCSSVTLITLSI